MDMIWYKTLNKPALTPPDYVFTPAWLFLYVLIVLSLIVFKNANSVQNKTAGYVYFTIQIVLNFLWTPVFFALHNIVLSFTIICFLTIFVVLNIIEFYKVSKISAALLVPYVVWICFAAYLNYGFMMLNSVR